METQRIVYNDKVVRQFAIMTIVWGVVGMLVGVLIAAQLRWPALNFDLPFLTYARLRPLHTNAVIFAFGGNILFATSFYSVQRTCRTSLFGGPGSTTSARPALTIGSMVKNMPSSRTAPLPARP